LIRASHRLGLLIDELLNLSQAGRITLAPSVFNLLEVVATVRQDLVDLIQRKQALILTEGSLPEVAGDKVRVTQLLTNLVSNGLKYNTEPMPQVAISASVRATDPAHVTVMVRDNGIGIDPAFHEHVFGIFRRLHQADEFEGTGAGLAICKKIVEAHGGRIWVESALGQGAAFYFTLPRFVPGQASTLSNAEDRSLSIQARGGNAGANGRSATPRIVLVEDQADVALIIQKLGKRDGLSITWFATAEDALVYLHDGAADLLLLDVNLPGMNGVELLRQLRRLDHLKQVPAAMFTPDQDPDQLTEYRQAGADYFLTKDLLGTPVHWQRRIRELVQLIH
jgi:CheY-like chemotaxis protein